LQNNLVFGTGPWTSAETRGGEATGKAKGSQGKPGEARGGQGRPGEARGGQGKGGRRPEDKKVIFNERETKKNQQFFERDSKEEI
jgi:hypothetical protein